MKAIPIFFTFDNNYVRPAAVAFYSLLRMAKPNISYAMFVLHSDITVENQRLLKDVVSRFPGSSLEFRDTKGFLKDIWDRGSFDGIGLHNNFTADTLVRCFGARFFPEYERIIYSDVDVVFADDISELYDWDLSDAYYAGVMDYEANSRARYSYLDDAHFETIKGKYCAGGIWVLDLAKIRGDNLEEKMMAILKDDTIVKRWNDQDVMNLACGRRVAHIPLNYISNPLVRIWLNEGVECEFAYTRAQLFDSLIAPKIIHYAAIKPWMHRCEYGEHWWDVFDCLGLDETGYRRPMLQKTVVKRMYRLKRSLKRVVLLTGVLAVTCCILCALLLMR